MNRRGGLGRGLAALIPPGEQQSASLVEVPVDAVVPNARQPREVFDEAELEGLATSIRDMGLLQPIVVRSLEDDRYELIAGERRLRAARIAGLETIPALVRHTEDADLLKEALVENIHRVQLNPLEEAAAYQQLLEEFAFTQDELAKRLGKSRPAISNALRLLHLPQPVQRRVAAGVLSAGHAKALLAVPDDRDRERLAERIVAEGLSVRATEEYVRLRLVEDETADAEGAGRRRRPRASRVTAPGLVELQDDLSDALQSRVKITMGARKGRLQVEFASVDDLERIVGVIARGLEPDGADATVTASAGEPDARSVPEDEPEDGHGSGLGTSPRYPSEVGRPPVDPAAPESGALDPSDVDLDDLEELTRPDG